MPTYPRTTVGTQCTNIFYLLFFIIKQKIEILKYTDSEYKEHLVSETWSREETDRLFDWCERFDLRFIVIQGRWNYGEYENTVKRTTEDLKDRYYSVCNTLTKVVKFILFLKLFFIPTIYFDTV